MNKRGWSARVVVRYVLVQMPAVALLGLILLLVEQWLDIPGWLAWGLLALWVAKDVILFPFVWRAYDWDSARDASSMVGARGVAEDRLAPAGYVRVRGELWQAEVTAGGPPINQGECVRVRGIRGLTLLVRPDNEETE